MYKPLEGKPQQHHSPPGEWYHATFHTVTSMVGVGVLGLPFALSQLGWMVGVLGLAVVCAVSFYTGSLLIYMHESRGKRFSRYRDLGQAILGDRWGKWIIIIFQTIVLVGMDITYVITAADSMMKVQTEICAMRGNVCSHLTLTQWMIIFGVMQLFLSQLPDMHSIWWVSLMGAIMSICYCGIALGGNIAVGLQQNNDISFEIRGDSQSDKVFNVLNGLGAVTFSYGGHSVLLEIQATLKEKSRKSMMWALSIAFSVVVWCYFTVAVSGYAAFGNTVEADVLVSISKPRWLVAVANFMALVHILASYQIYSQPVFESLECKQEWSSFGKYSAIVQRILYRSLYVILTVFIGCALPFFGELMGFFGAIGFTPMTFVIPSVLWLAGGYERTIGGRILNYMLIVIFTFVGFIACVGSLRLIVQDAHTYHFFS
eukprot:TRINITY_DN4331_c0_g1_i1.p1 TRINITY_DN4331_c0_g1~~TRINITY_DN4331_c0_g1_i1.p1  ORF type:complete len:429 (-),score=21.23 TRINITY_DN4331_c0_g1_i1:914-2200(-)